MSEVLIHLIIPAAALIVFGFDRKLVLYLCPFGVLPDLDILFGIHRGAVHSIFVLGAISAALLLFTKYYKPEWKTHVVIIALLLLSHPLLDLITGPVQILWPINLQFYLKIVAPMMDPTTLAIYFTEFPIQLLIYTPADVIPGMGQPFPLFENTGIIALILIGMAMILWLIKSRKNEGTAEKPVLAKEAYG
jgi:membrane-bound metal-dependent hydrolase YbcI (DUF457 family)